MPFAITIEQHGDVTILRCEGQMWKQEDGPSIFRDEVIAQLNKGNRKLLVDLENTTYIDSCGTGELVSAFTTTTNRGCLLKLMSVNGRVKDTLQNTKLYTVFEVYDDEAQAVRSFA